jgi:cysteine desulfuration protein SufE
LLSIFKKEERIFAVTIHAEDSQFLRDLKRVENAQMRLSLLIHKGRSLSHLPDRLKSDKYLVPGCLSRSWIFPWMLNGRLHFQVDSEAAIVKGVLAVLRDLLSGQPPRDIANFSGYELKEYGLSTLLSVNRRNGLANILQQIKLYATAFDAQQKDYNHDQ